MKLLLGNGSLGVQREQGDPRAKNESHFWYLLRQRLNGKLLSPGDYPGRFERPYPPTYQTGNERWIKRAPEKDGAMTGAPYYLRERKKRGEVWLYVFDREYARRDPARDYNAGELVRLETGNLLDE